MKKSIFDLYTEQHQQQPEPEKKPPIYKEAKTQDPEPEKVDPAEETPDPEPEKAEEKPDPEPEAEKGGGTNGIS